MSLREAEHEQFTRKRPIERRFISLIQQQIGIWRVTGSDTVAIFSPGRRVLSGWHDS